MFERFLEVMILAIGFSIAVAFLCTCRLLWTISDNMHKDYCEYQQEYYEPFEEQ